MQTIRSPPPNAAPEYRYSCLLISPFSNLDKINYFTTNEKKKQIGLAILIFKILRTSLLAAIQASQLDVQ